MTKKKLTEEQVEKIGQEIAKQLQERKKELSCTKEELDKAKNYLYHSVNKILDSHPLAYGILSRVNMKCFPGLKTFGVCTNKVSIELLYDPKTTIEWYEATENSQSMHNKVCLVLLHEAYHLVFGHVTMGWPAEINLKNPTSKDHYLKHLANVAQDFKINENIQEIWNGDGPGQIFDKGCGKTALQKMLNLKETGNNNWIDLYELLKKSQQNQMPETTDQHGLGDEEVELTEEEKEQIRAEVQRIIKKSAEQLTEQQRGNLPGAIQKVLDDLLAP